jgi:hypothetical protein
METIMSTTNDNDTPRDELGIEQVDVVSGGAFPIVHVQLALLNACIVGIENNVMNGPTSWDGPAHCEIPAGMKG